MIYRKLRRVWSHNDMNHIHGFFATFPELRSVSSEEMCERWARLGIDFYSKDDAPVTVWVRITLPFAAVVYFAMILFLPFNFLFTGRWGYGFSDKNVLYNWFHALF